MGSNWLSSLNTMTCKGDILNSSQILLRLIMIIQYFSFPVLLYVAIIFFSM